MVVAEVAVVVVVVVWRWKTLSAAVVRRVTSAANCLLLLLLSLYCCPSARDTKFADEIAVQPRESVTTLVVRVFVVTTAMTMVQTFRVFIVRDRKLLSSSLRDSHGAAASFA